MFVHALPGAASFAACLRLFRSYPLSVNPSPPAGAWLAGPARRVRDGSSPVPAARSGDGDRSIVLRHRGGQGSGYYVLTYDPADHFTLRPWHPDEGECQEIRPGSPVSAASHRVITQGMPVPRDGALLGWVSDRQATVLMSVYHGRPRSPASLPQVRVLALAGSDPIRWPPFTVSPLDDGRLWEYVERGEIVDLAPVVREAEQAFWVPSQNPARARQRHGCVVIGQSLTAQEYWLPAGIYLDHWMLREGVPAPPARHLLTLPGATALSRRFTTW